MGLVNPTHEYGWLSFALTGAATHAAGESLGHVKNPEAADIIVTKCILYGITNSTGAANATVGHATTVAGGHDTTQLCAATALAAISGTAVNGFAEGDAADAYPIVPEGSYIVACGSADTSGFTGRVYIEYVRAG